MSGLGLKDQEYQVRNFLRPGDKILDTFTEIESGRKDDRPKLAMAIKTARLKNATLLIAKLDRLARSVRLITELQESSVRFIVCEYPDANEAMIQMSAVMAQDEAKKIAQRTKAALAQAKRNGVKLGNPQNLKTNYEDQLKGGAAMRDKADRFAKDFYPIIEHIREQGVGGLRAIARELNKQEFKTVRGKEWTPTAVKNLLRRIEK